jgi:hypothetical protein
MRPEPLHGERGLRLGAVPRETLPDEAQVERWDLVAEHAAQQATLAERAHERPVDLSRRPLARERDERVAGEPLRLAQQLQVFAGEMGVGRVQGITAVATSSTRAASSNSALTPSRAIAG